METELEGWEGVVVACGRVSEKALGRWDRVDLHLEWRKGLEMT